MPKRAHHVDPAPVLPPPQAADGRYSRAPVAGHAPRPYQQYSQYQNSAPQASGQWYPMANSPQVSPLGWPPAAEWSHGGWSSAPPPRRSGGFIRVLLGLVGAGAGVFFALVVLSAMVHPALPSQDAISSHVPAAASDPGAKPVDPSRVGAVLTANTLYSQGGLANGNCPAADLGRASTEEQTRFYQRLMSCLSAEWRQPIESAGFHYTRPGLVVFDSPVSTPCGNAAPESGRTLAFYCPMDAVMYADVPQMRRFFGGLDVAYAVVIGHEFGHHVQSETGMLAAVDRVRFTGTGSRVELSRRIELQASCMGGLFLGAVAGSFPVDDRRLTELQQVAGSFGDEPGAAATERDHGSGESNRRWIITGFDSNDIARCNTFTASEAEVS